MNVPSTDTKARIRLGMFMIGGNEWRGGLNYQRTLLQALAGPLANRFETLLFVSRDQLAVAKEVFAEFLPEKLVVDDRAEGAGTGRRAIKALVKGADTAAAAMMAEHGVDIVFENARFLGSRFPLPAISWMPDFQHRALPHLFTRYGWWKRDIGFRAQTTGRRVVMLSSETARRDCENYYSASRGRTAVVRFAPSLDTETILARRGEVRATHEVPEHFFFMPNQFWTHKNQTIVVEALEIIQTRGQLKKVPPVILSGPVSDNRKVSFFDALMDRVRDQGLALWFRHLGLIPMPDVLSLNAAARAVLNPSFFEGWASSVEEAKALGSPMILSDIDVHREQAPDARFFAPDDAVKLADMMLAVATLPPARFEDAASLTKQANRRQEVFVEAFAATIDRAYALRNRSASSYQSF